MESAAAPDELNRALQGLEEHGSDDLIVVGIGAAEGGAEALLHFFEQMHLAETMAFMVLITLPPEQLRALAEQLTQNTAMDVTIVEGRIPLKANQICLIPQQRRLLLTGTTLRIGETEYPSGQRVAIDLGLRAIAETFDRNTVGVILSGAGSDGALGIPRIKEVGGVTMAQDPGEAAFDGMPRAAIATGFIDYVLPAAQIPAKILDYRAAGQRLRLPADQMQRDADVNALRELFALLRVRTGHDFAHYKRPTVMRRIGRRMQVNGVLDIPSYLLLLRERPGEVEALLRDLLISVTNFFRDREAFEALESLMPGIFAGKGPDDSVRVWVAGCATGEEAYSVAMLLHEYASRLPQAPAIQIFATDIDEEAIAQARDGHFRDNIAADVSPERLRRYFSEEQGGYRIKKEIRDLVLFAVHNVLRDPPFSRLDLVTCRNLLIYLDRDVQERVLELFHFVLRPDGRLLLGSSESADSLPGLFTAVDKKQRIYARRVVSRSAPVLPMLPATALGPRRLSAEAAGAPRTLSFAELHQRLVEEYAPPSLIVNEAYEIVHLSSRVGRYLQFSGGEPSYNLLRVVHPDLRLELRAALFRAAQRDRPSEARNVRLTIDGQQCLVNLAVRPVQHPEGARGFLLVLIEEQDEAATDEASRQIEEGAEPMVRQLDEELHRMREQLRVTIEQYETSTEELRASNEELQAMNEELRSTTEELETSKEELQSVNEELITVNQELKNKVDELSRVNADLQNLMASTDIGTIFLDRQLRVKLYTPTVQTIFNLIATDINRPLSHVTHQLHYDLLLDDIARVLERLVRVDREVQHMDGRWFLARLLPYRTMEDRIDGVVLTFVDITERMAAEMALMEAKEQLEARVAERTGVLEAEVKERRQVELSRRELLRRVVSAQEDERRRISREIHDQLGQQLTGLLLGLRAIKQALQSEDEALAKVEQLEHLVGTINNEMGQLARALRPTALDDLGLVAALDAYSDEWSKRSGIPVAFHSRGLDGARLPLPIETTIYRVALEAMHNILKHAQATQVSLILERRDGAAVAIIEDNGQGFDAEHVLARPSQWGLGLLGIQERVALVNGTLAIESTPGLGATVFVRVPIPQE